MRKLTVSLLSLWLVAPAAADDPPARRGMVGLAVRQPRNPSVRGAEIVRLEIGSPAYRSDVRPGDIITHLNGSAVSGSAAFAAQLQRCRAGSRWNLTVNRDGQVQSFNLVADAVRQEQDTADVDVRYTWVRAADGTALRALITVPASSRGPFPAIVIVPGLGNMACDEPDYAMYRDLAWEFSRRGFAVIRWDPRGAGDSYGPDFADVDFDTTVSDAVSILRACLKLPDLDRRRIYGFAYGLGGVVAAHVSARQDGLAALITWGTISRPLVEYMIDVARSQGRLAGLGAPETNRQVRLTIRLFERMLSGEDPLDIVRQHPQLRDFVQRGGYVQGKNARFWRQLDSTLYARLYGNSSVPVLALFGEHDFNATLLDQSNIVALAQAAGRRDAHSVIVPGTDHYMNSVSSPEESFARLKDRQYRFHPLVVEATAKWIDKLEAFRTKQASPPLQP